MKEFEVVGYRPYSLTDSKNKTKSGMSIYLQQINHNDETVVGIKASAISAKDEIMAITNYRPTLGDIITYEMNQYGKVVFIQKIA